MGSLLPSPERGTAPPSFRPMSIVAKRSPISHLSCCWALVYEQPTGIQWFIRLHHSMTRRPQNDSQRKTPANITGDDTAEYCCAKPGWSLLARAPFSWCMLCSEGTFHWSADGQTKSKRHYADRIFITLIRAEISAHRPTCHSLQA